MKAKIKEKWLKALRSGEYKQGKNQLKTITKKGNERFCCLGVLCDLYAKETGNEWKPYNDNIPIAPAMHRETGILPPEVQNWAELESDNPVVQKSNLAALNDGNTSFKKIAKLIEKEL